MDSRVLECFLRVAELGSINRAAVDLNLSQPALSRQIAGLEHEMQVQLFIRSQGGVRLTEAGKLLSDRVRPLLRQFAVIKAQVGERAAGLLAI
ncbi:MAG: LysR family transcriptional regulator, partial [Pusillimonas sp.]